MHNISSLYPTKNICSNIPFFPKKNIVSIISSMWVSNTISGWWLSHPSEQCARQLSWWNSQSMESHKIHVPNHQPAIITVITKYLCECLTHSNTTSNWCFKSPTRYTSTRALFYRPKTISPPRTGFPHSIAHEASFAEELVHLPGFLLGFGCSIVKITVE